MLGEVVGLESGGLQPLEQDQPVPIYPIHAESRHGFYMIKDAKLERHIFIHFIRRRGLGAVLHVGLSARSKKT